MPGFLDQISVWFGNKELQTAKHDAYPHNAVAKVETFEEVWVQSQVQGYAEPPADGPPQPSETEINKLPGGGAQDKLLAPGQSSTLLTRMAAIFRDDPPVMCGANRDLVGLSCAYRENYSKMVFSPAAVAKHLQLAFTFWTPMPQDTVQRTVVPPGSRLIIVGDTHGQLEDVLWLFFKYGPPSPTNQYIFNGDIVDRGGHALEILLLLFAIKRDCPSSVHILRGNHEDVSVSLHFGFRAELENKFQSHFGVIWNICTSMVFPLMPLVSIITGPLTGGRHFCVLHGGVPVDCPGQDGPVSLQDEIAKLDRVKTSLQATRDKGDHYLFNLVWADPTDTATRKKVGQAGRGNRFTEKETVDFCEKNSLAFVVRSHEVPRSLRGASASHGGRTYTVFSASNYMGTVGNRGGVFICEVDKGLQLNEHWAPPWRLLADLYEKHWTSPQAEKNKVVESWEASYLNTNQEVTSNSGAENSPRTAASPPAESLSRAGDQILQFIVERVCESKDQLFNECRGADNSNSGMLPKATWSEIMLRVLVPLCDQVLTPQLLDNLANRWGMKDPVSYVRFLHRFQIRGSEDVDDPAQPDLLREVSALRRQLVDAPSGHVERMLDPDGDRTVSLTEFQSFLPTNLEVTPLQGAVLYELMVNFTNNTVLTLDSTIMCLALMTRDPPAQSQWTEVAESIGNEVTKSGRSYAYAFRSWDTDKDGFLSLQELQEGLKKLLGARLQNLNVVHFMHYVEGMGVKNGRVSIFEFVRAIAPRDWAMQLHQALLKDLLKRVWICRPALHALLAKSDPQGTNRATVPVFNSCLEEINRQLEIRGRPQLSATQVQAISEIASKGKKFVRYEEFIRGLQVIDTVS